VVLRRERATKLAQELRVGSGSPASGSKTVLIIIGTSSLRQSSGDALIEMGAGRAK